MRENGMRIDEIPAEVQRLKDSPLRFSDGRIDYTDASEAPVLNIYATHERKVLLVRRSPLVGWLKERWHVPAGFLDDEKTLEQKVYEELEEETGIRIASVRAMTALEPVVDKDEHKRWKVYPVHVELNRRPRITLDYEHTARAWASPWTLYDFNLLPLVRDTARRVL